MTIRVLALDLSTTTGVAFDTADNIPAFSTWELAPAAVEDYGTRYADLAYRLEAKIAEVRPHVVAFERPIIPQGRKFRLHVVRLLVGLAAVAETIAAQHRLRRVEIPVSTVKQHFGARSGSSDKSPITARCLQLGWKVRNDDEADAASIWSYVKCCEDPSFSYVSTPLFGRRA